MGYQPKVSVIMATYNTEKEQLKTAIDSILGQTYSNLEFIIICDGICEDIKIIEEYHDKRMILMKNEENKGLPYSLNKAIERATGKYIARMDSDDIATKNRIKQQVKFMEKHQDITVCSMYAKLIGDESGYKILVNCQPEEVKCQLLYRACMIHPCVMIRTEKKKKENYRYNEEFKCAQDFELWTRMIKTEKMQIIPKIGLYYRVHKKQASISKQEQQMKFATTILKRNLNNIGYKEEEKESIEALLILSGRKVISEDNYKMLSQWIERTIEKNKEKELYKQSVLKRILYNRFLELVLRNKRILTRNIIDILKNKKTRKQLVSYQNVYFCVKLLYSTIILKLQNIVI